MAGLKVKIDGKQYAVEVDPSELTLGELEFLQGHFGLADIREYNFLEPRQITGVVAVGVQRAHEEMDTDEVLAKARKLKYGLFIEAFQKQAEEEEKKADPQAAGGNDSAPAKGKSRSGAQSTPTT